MSQGITKILETCVDEICEALKKDDIITAQKLLTIFKSITGEDDLIYMLLEDMYNRHICGEEEWSDECKCEEYNNEEEI